MYKNFKVSCILLLSGEGSRFGSSIPKQFHKLFDKKIYLYALDTFYNLNIFDEIILVCHKDWIDPVKKETRPYKNTKVTAGGKTRQESSFLGLQACLNPHFVLLHDSVRAFVSKKIILSNLDSVLKYKAVNTCIKSTDTIVEIDEDNKIKKIPKRSSLLRGQTPQSFEYNLILNAHRQALKNNIRNATDDCQLVLNQIKVHVVNGDSKNIKITTKEDFLLAKHFMQ